MTLRSPTGNNSKVSAPSLYIFVLSPLTPTWAQIETNPGVYCAPFRATEWIQRKGTYNCRANVGIVGSKFGGSPMMRSFWLIVVLFGIPATAFGQSDISDSQTLRALLTEVRALGQDLLSSMARVQRGQILLSRLQTQQANVARAGDRLHDAR